MTPIPLLWLPVLLFTKPSNYISNVESWCQIINPKSFKYYKCTRWPNKNGRRSYIRNGHHMPLEKKLREVKWLRKIAGKYFIAYRVAARGRYRNGLRENWNLAHQAYLK